MKQFKLPIAIYARYSSDLQNERSCEDQIIGCRQYIEKQDDLRGRPIEIFTDNAISGSYIGNRPSMMRLMDAIEQQNISALVSESLDRVSRNLGETDEIYQLCEYYYIPIFTVMGGRAQKIHVGVAGMMNAMHIEQLAHRVKRGQAGSIRQGKSAGSVAYGYKIKYLNDQGLPEKGLREIRPEHAKIVQRIYNEFCSGKKVYEIVASLNKEDIPSPRGGKWTISTVIGHRGHSNGILQNAIYIGQIVWNRHNRTKHPITGVRHMRQNPKDTWIYHTCEGLRIISDEQWNKVQHLIQKSLRPHNRPRKNSPPLEFNIYCSQCGAKMIRQRFNYVACINHQNSRTCTQNRYININKTRRAIYEQIALDPSTLWDEWRAHLLESGKDKQDQINKTKKECEEYRGNIKRLIEELSVRGCTDVSLHKHIAKNYSDLEKAEKKLASLPSLATMNKRKFKTLIKAWAP